MPWAGWLVRPREIEPYSRSSPIEIFNPLFKFCYVGRVGLEPTTGGL